LVVVARSIQRDKAQKEERVEECRKKQLGEISVVVVGND
jgi:hypothetical protein